MNHKKKFAFLSVTLASMLVFGACNKPAENTSSNQPESTTSAQPTETSQSVAPSESSTTSVAPTTSSTNPPSSSSSSSSSTSVAPTVVSIAVNLDNVKTAYTRGEALNLTGLVVTGTFSDGTSRAVRSYTTNPANGTVLNEVGEKDIVVTYKEVTTSFKVTVANQKFTVKFVVNGQEVQSGEVEEGQKAVYNGEEPTKAADANAVKYRFKGWDKDLNQPITQNTTFTAVFAEYAAEQVVDNFESYEGNSDMADAWKVEAYTTAWGDTAANVAIGSKATQGTKSMRFNGWENGTGYRFLKHNEIGAFSKSANAIKFNLQIPSINTVKVILKGKATIMGQVQEPSFTYEFHPTTSEYVEYVIPLADSAWQLWGEAGKTIKTAADMIGAHVDDITNYITDVGFFVQGNDGGSNLPYFAFVDNISFVTIDEPVQASQVETMGRYTKYTGLLNDGHTVKVELGVNGAATATIIDMETPMEIQGNVAIDADKNMTFTSADNGTSLVYKAALKNGGQSMKFVEASGTMAQGVSGVDLNAVQVVDNYEQYTESGKLYYQSNMDMNARSGARGAYYAEYFAGSNSPVETFGGDGWTLMGGSGDQVTLMKNGGHSGNNYLQLKSSSSVAMRYMQWGLFDGTSEQNNFRGSKLSFWAKADGNLKAFKVAMYSQTKPRNATKDQYVRQESFPVTAAIGEWKHYEIDLNPALTYYGFLVFMDHNDKANTFLYIDDVEVYTASPYATYIPPVQNKELVAGNAYLGKVNGLINATLRIKSATEVSLAAPGLGMQLDGTYSITADELTMVIGGATYKATISEELDKLTFVSVDGSNQVAGALNNLSFDIIRGDNVESYTETGRTIKKGDEDESKNSGSSGAFYIDIYKDNTSVTSPVGGSKWDLTGSGAGAALNKEDAAEGSQSLKLLNSGYGNMRYIQWSLYKGTAKAMTGMTSFSVYLKNYSADTTQKVKIMAYKVQKVDNAHQGADYRTEKEVTLEAGQSWTKYTVTLDASKTYYGFALLINSKWNSKDYYVGADAMCFSNVENDPSLNFYAKQGLALSGTITAGAASMTFGQNGAITLNCVALGGDLAGTYEMAMDGANQMITVKTSMGNITGKYAISAAGVVTLEVTAVTGDLAAGVNVGAVLANAN